MIGIDDNNCGAKIVRHKEGGGLEAGRRKQIGYLSKSQASPDRFSSVSSHGADMCQYPCHFIILSWCRYKREKIVCNIYYLHRKLIQIRQIKHGSYGP